MRLGLVCSVSLLPMLFTGCCTYLTADFATHAYRHDTVRRIENAVITRDSRLVVLVEGATAESPKIKPFTIILPLPTTEEGVWLPRDAMTEGWHSEFFNDTNMTTVTVVQPVVIGAYESALGHSDRFPISPGAIKTLYLVKHSPPDAMTPLLYVTHDRHPRKLEIGLDGRDVKTPRRYPLLLLLPFTLAFDFAALPFEIYFMSTYGDKPRHIESIRD